jgi:hypothetical protein
MSSEMDTGGARRSNNNKSEDGTSLDTKNEQKAKT